MGLKLDQSLTPLWADSDAKLSTTKLFPKLSLLNLNKVFDKVPKRTTFIFNFLRQNSSVSLDRVLMNVKIVCEDYLFF